MRFGRFCLLVLCIATITPASAEIALRLQGSNTIGAKLAPALAKAFLEQRGVAQVSVQPTAVENEFLVSGTERRDGAAKTVGITVAAHGSATGFQALAAQQADIALASRPIKADERTLLLAFGDMESSAAEHAMALDGLAILVNARNPLKRLSRENRSPAYFPARLVMEPARRRRRLPVTIYARATIARAHGRRSRNWCSAKRISSARRRSDLSRTINCPTRWRPRPAPSALPALASISGRAKAVAVADGGAQSLVPAHLSVATEEITRCRAACICMCRRARPQRSHVSSSIFV